MANNYQEFITKISLNDKEAKRELEELQKMTERYKKLRDEAAKKGNTKEVEKLTMQIAQADKAMRRYRTQIQNVDATLKNLSGATLNDLKKAQRALIKEMGNTPRSTEYYRQLEKKLRDVKNEMKGVKEESVAAGKSLFWDRLRNINQVGLFFANLFGLGNGLSGIATKIANAVDEGVVLARTAEGIEKAFARIDRPGMLDNLRKATHGTVDDLMLMQQAVKFKDFNLPVEQLGTYLAFAQQKAKDTGESIDHLVDSIVTGLGRQSPQILDNLGLSAKQISEEAKRSGDFFGAVAKIVEQRMSEAGEYMETSLDRAAQAATRLKNAQVEMGKELVPLKEKTDEMATSLQLNAINGVKWLVQHANAVKGITVAVGLYTGALVLYNTVQKLANISAENFNKILKRNVIGLIVVALGFAISKLLDYRDRMREAKEQQEELYNVEAKAVKQYSEESAKIKALNRTLRDERVSIDERKKALDRLREIIPSYNGMLDEEGRLTRDNKQAIDEYLVSLERQIRLKAYQSKLEELYKRQADQEEARQQASDDYWNERQNNSLSGYDRNGITAKLLRVIGMDEESNLKKQLDKADEAISDTNQKIENLMQKIADMGDVEIIANEENGGNGTNNSSSTNTTTPTKNTTTTNQLDKELKERENKIKLSNERELMNNVIMYRRGERDYRTYIAEQNRITADGIRQRMAVYEELGETDRAEYLALIKAQSDEENRIKEQNITADLNRLQRESLMKKAIARAAFTDETSEMYGNEEMLNERLFEIDMDFMQQRLAALSAMNREGTEEYLNLQTQMETTEMEHRAERERNYLDRLQRYREQFLRMGNEQQLQIAMQGLEDLHRRQLLSEEEYQRMRLAIQAQYAQNPTERRNEEFDAKVNDAITLAQARATGGYDKGKGMSMANNPIMGEVAQYRSVMQQLQTMREQDQINHQEYEQAKAQVTSEFLANMVSQVQAAYESVNQVMQAASSYYAAQSQYEQAVTTRKYDREIEAAGNNEKRRKKIEEQKQKELAKIKTKYNKKAMKIEIAQAFASTAMAAINSYASASKEHWLLGAVAAAMATAAGMMQIATIKKQHAAEEAGYYEGGFTGGNNWRKRAGVVHEGEFVVNHDGVANPNLLPILRAIDVAQRNNTIGRITPVDIGMGNGGTNVVTPIVNVNNDNSELDRSISSMNETISRLNDTLAKGINADVYLDGPDGLAAKQKRFEQLTK